MIATRIVSLAVLLGSLLLFGCQSENTKLTKSWETISVDKNSLLKINVNSLSDDLIIKIKNDYASSPLDAGYKELKLSAVFRDEVENKFLAFFDILYVDDIQVVYVVSIDGALLNKYIYSVWQ